MTGVQTCALPIWFSFSSGEDEPGDMEALIKEATEEPEEEASGMSDEEAQEFHAYYMQGLVGFTAIAVIAHALVWAWRPWIT